MRVSCWLVAIPVLLWALALQAAPLTDPRELLPEQKAAVERLANEGATLFLRGDFASALKKFELAEDIVRIPTITLERGRSLERLGRWVDASSAYESAATAELPATASFQHRLAQQDAAKALSEIAPKIPKVTVVIAKGVRAEIFVDGRSLGPAKSDPLLIDPGKHVLEARGSGGATATKAIDLLTGANERVELVLVSLADQEAARARAQNQGPSLFQILGWTGVAVGGASLLVSLGTGVPAISARSDLDERCPEGRCAPDVWADVDRYDALRWTAGVTLFAGALIGGGGVALLLLDPAESAEKPATQTVSLSPVLLPGFAGLRGTFP